MSERHLDLQFRREVIRKTTPVHGELQAQQNEKARLLPGLIHLGLR